MENRVTVDAIVSVVWEYMNTLRGRLAESDVVFPALYVLYGYHKQYKIEDHSFGFVRFYGPDDELLHQLGRYHEPFKMLDFPLDNLYKSISSIPFDEYNSLYAKVIYKLLEKLVLYSPQSVESYFTPSSLVSLMGFIANKEQISSVYDPFCGINTIERYLRLHNDSLSFCGYEISRNTCLLAKVLTEANGGKPQDIKNEDSIMNWDRRNFDAVITCPPFGLRMSREQRAFLDRSLPTADCRTVEELIFILSFSLNHAKLVLALMPMKVCANSQYDDLRHYLVDRNLLDTVIALPQNLLYETSTPCVIIVGKSNRKENEPVKLIRAQDYYIGEKRVREFDLEHFYSDINSGNKPSICSKVSLEEIRNKDYNIAPLLYEKVDVETVKGKIGLTLGNLISPVYSHRTVVTVLETLDYESVSTSSLKKDFIDVLLNENLIAEESDKRWPSERVYIAQAGKKYLLVGEAPSVHDNRYGLRTNGKNFAVARGIRVFEINEDAVSPKYLVYLLTNHPAFSKNLMTISSSLKYKVYIDTKKLQEEIVTRLVQQYNQKRNAEQEADAKRLGVAANISDLAHQLKTPRMKIQKIIDRLERMTPESTDYKSVLKSLRDNFEYLNRLILYNHTQIDPADIVLKENDFSLFIKSYVEGWENYGGHIFKTDIKVISESDFGIAYNETYMTVLMDAIFGNAYRHGFNKTKKDENQVMVSLSKVEFENKAFALLRVSNNGKPFSDGFTLQDYISKGRYSATSGRSGLGGYHVYQIVKAHHGYLNIDSNKAWGTIIEILLPLCDNYIDINNLISYEHECV